MTNHHIIRERFVHQLEALREDVLAMGTMVETSLQQAIKSLETWDIALAQHVIQDDVRIDHAQHQLEETAMRLIAMQQPVASDLRLLGMVFALAAELERIGDYASRIARRFRRTSKRTELVIPPAQLYTMARVAQDMFNRSLDAFVNQDTTKAYAVTHYNHQLEALEQQLLDTLIHTTNQTPERIDATVDILDVVHMLERVGRRANNIAERVIYIETNVFQNFGHAPSYSPEV